MNTHIFVNPTSGGYSACYFDRTVRALKEQGHNPTVLYVRTPAEIISCCSTINQTAAPLVIVAAGDGTFNAVVNGLIPGVATLAVLPFGTSNVLAAELGIKTVEDGIARICAGKTQPLSVGLLELHNLSRRFVLMAGIGLDGAVVRDVLPFAKKHLKQGAYALSALWHACAWDSSSFEISAAGQTFSCHSAIICNGSRYGGNFVLASERTIFSDGFETILIPECDRRAYAGLALDLFRHRAHSSCKLVRLSVDSLEIRGNKPVQIDGDFVGYGPGRLSKLKNFARIIT